MWGSTDQKNSNYGHFSDSGLLEVSHKKCFFTFTEETLNGKLQFCVFIIFLRPCRSSCPIVFCKISSIYFAMTNIYKKAQIANLN